MGSLTTIQQHKLSYLTIVSFSSYLMRILGHTTERTNPLLHVYAQHQSQREGYILRRKILKWLNTHKARGPSHIPTRLLQDLTDELAPTLITISQSSLVSGPIPDNWSETISFAKPPTIGSSSSFQAPAMYYYIACHIRTYSWTIAIDLGFLQTINMASYQQEATIKVKLCPPCSHTRRGQQCPNETCSGFRRNNC